MGLSFAAMLCAVLLAGCARQSDLDAANAKLTAANATIATDEEKLAAADKTIDDLKAQLAAAPTPSEQSDTPSAAKQELPVSWIVRKAFQGPGLVMVLSTTVKAPLEIQASVRNPKLGTVKEVQLHLNPSAPTNLDSSQGAVIEAGDVITLSNDGYSPMTLTVR